VLDFLRVVPRKRKVKLSRRGGLIFSNPPKHKRIVFHVANLLFFGAIIYGLYLYIPLFSAVYKYKFSKSEMVVEKVDERPESTEYVVQIPKILAYSKVVENVSPFDQAEYYRVLKDNVIAQAKGSQSPGGGLGSSTYLFAHSTNEGMAMVRNNAVFYLLGELQNEDMVFVNYHGKELKYKVIEKKVVKADDLDYLTYSDPEREVLILQTCWPIGTDWNRLLILAELIP